LALWSFGVIRFIRYGGKIGLE